MRECGHHRLHGRHPPFLVVHDGKVVASCTSQDAAEAAMRLMEVKPKTVLLGTLMGYVERMETHFNPYRRDRVEGIAEVAVKSNGYPVLSVPLANRASMATWEQDMGRQHVRITFELVDGGDL